MARMNPSGMTRTAFDATGLPDIAPAYAAVASRNVIVCSPATS